MILSYKLNLIYIKVLIPNKNFDKMEVATMEDITAFVKNTKERLDLKNDYVFKRIFAKPENNQELEELLEAILNIEIEKVVEDLDEMSADENERLEAYKRQVNMLYDKIEKEEWKKEGRNEGIQMEKEKNALKMLQEGIDINIIIKVTGLTEEKIEELKINLNNK